MKIINRIDDKEVSEYINGVVSSCVLVLGLHSASPLNIVTTPQVDVAAVGYAKLGLQIRKQMYLVINPSFLEFFRKPDYLNFDGRISNVDSHTILCHEMIHVWQYHTGALVDYGKRGLRYKGEWWPAKAIIQLRATGHGGHLPWERQAYSKQEALSRVVKSIQGYK